jgi:serine protease AprX
MKNADHEHAHAQNRFAVIPTPVRLDADRSRTGRGVTIAFLDSGFYPHPDLTEPVNRILAFKDITGAEDDALSADRRVESWHWHGTMTSVVAAGSGRLSDGVYRGLASNAQVVLVKVSDREGRITEETIARGIEWVMENQERYRIRVLNISLGGDEDVPCRRSIIDRAAEEAVRRGIVVVAAAGNSGCTEKHASIPPANSPSVITVGGYTDDNQLQAAERKLYCSNYGPTADGTVKPELIAPAMWVAAPILPGTSSFRMAESLSKLYDAPDYLLSSLVQEMKGEALLPASIEAAEEASEIRALVDSLLRQNKIIAAHYQHVDGTSFAAPVVSSCIAQMLEANPKLTPAAVKQILISTAKRISSEPLVRQGYGVLNARRAVEEATRERHTLAEESFGPPRLVRGRMLFSYHDDRAQRVQLAGDFNNWDASSVPFKKESSGIWQAEVANLSPGSYRYKLVVDGERWIDDPVNGLKEPDNYGGWNSVLNIN